MKDKKKKIVLAVITVALLVFMFKSNINELFSSEIPGCMDKNCTAFYNPKANVDDGSCKCDNLVSDSFLDSLTHFKNRDWNSAAYKRLKNHIYIAENGNQKAFNLLDNAYMVVLSAATDIEVSKCFEPTYMTGDTLEKEVERFYKDHRSKSTKIQSAMSWFKKHEEVRSFPNKVNKIVRKEFNESNFNALKKQITDFRKSSEYRDKLKDCSKLSTIISANLLKLSNYKAT